METEFKLEGEDNFLRNLSLIEEKVEKKIADKANRAGAALYRKELRKQLKARSGTGVKLRTWKTDIEGKKGQTEDVHLYDRIAIRKKGGRTFVKHVVGYVGLAKAYGHVYEFGSVKQAGNRLWTRTLRTMARRIFEKEREVIASERAKLGFT